MLPSDDLGFMTVTKLEQKVLAVARADQPSDRVPHAFEKRIMAHIRSLQDLPVMDGWAFWGKWMWRAAAPCVAVTFVLGVWSFYTNDAVSTELSLENTVLAAVDNSADAQ